MPTYLITGATGKQGGAVARHLLTQNHAIHCLVRDPLSPAAIALQSQGAILFPGTYSSLPSLLAAAEGCVGLFMNLMPSPLTPHSEFQDAENILSAAKQAGIKHVVYSTVLKTGQHKSFPGWDDEKSKMAWYWLSKDKIENAVRGGGFERWTILRPGYFMTNLVLPVSTFMYPELAVEGVFRSAYKAETRLELVDPEDLGAVVGGILRDGEKWNGRELDVVGEERSVEEVVRIIGEVSGREVKRVDIGGEEVMEGWRGGIVEGQREAVRIQEVGIGKSDLRLLKELGVEMTGFREFLESKKGDLGEWFGGA